MTEAAAEVELDRSSIRLLYPFTFAPSAFQALAAAAPSTQWKIRGRSHAVWEPRVLPGEELVESVARFWNPTDGTAASTLFLCLRNEILQSPAGLCGRRPWTVTSGRRVVEVELAEVELTLSGAGAGCVTVDLRLRKHPGEGSADPNRVDTWGQLAYDLRFLHGRRSSTLAIPSEERRPTATFGELVAVLMGTISPGAAGLTLAGHAYPFTALFLRGADRPLVRSTVARLRYNARFGDTSSWDESAAGLGVIERTTGMLLYCSLTAAGFVGSDVPAKGYYSQFPGELRRVYWLALVVSLHQRAALMALSERTSERWLDDDPGHRLEAFKELQGELHYITARAMASQVTHKNAQHVFYATAQEVLGVRRLYDEVRESINDLSDAVRIDLSERMEAQARGFEQRVSVLALLFGVPSLVLAFIGANIEGVTSPDALSFVGAVALVLVSLVLGAVISTLVRRSGQGSR